MTTFQTTTYYNYSDAYNDIITQIKGSTALNPQQIADCLEALATIVSPTPTGSVNNTPVTPPSTGRPNPPYVNPNVA
jgi:hypothetical protein